MAHWSWPDTLKFEGLIASGSFGVIAAARDVENERFVSVRRMPMALVKDNETDFCRLARNVTLMTELNHSGILRVLSIFMGDARGREDIYFVHDECDSNLAAVFRMDVELTIEHVRAVFYNILVALRYLHSAGVHFGDLAPKHVLVNQDCSIKLNMFGAKFQFPERLGTASRKLRLARTRRRAARSTSVAPEQRLSREPSGAPADLWAAGCLLAGLFGMQLHGRAEDRDSLFPWACIDDTSRLAAARYAEGLFAVIGTPGDASMAWLAPEQREDIASVKHYSARDFTAFTGGEQGFADLLKSLVQFDPQARPTAEAALALPLFEEVRDASRETTAVQEVRAPATFEEVGPDFLAELARKDIEYFPTKLRLITMHVTDILHDGVNLSFYDMAGHELGTLMFSNPHRTTVGSLRVQVARCLDLRLQCFALLLPSARVLGDTDNEVLVSEILETEH